MLIYFSIALIMFIVITFCVVKFSKLDMKDDSTIAAVIIVNFLISAVWVLFVPLVIAITVLWYITKGIIKLVGDKDE